MADTGRSNTQRGGDNRRDNNRDSSRGEGGFDRKRSWRGDNDSSRGEWQERGAKQMKPGAMGIKVLVPSSIVGAIIGKGGEEMKRIKTESGCYVRLSQNDKYFPNSQERPCYVEGEPEEIVKVLDFMQEKVRSDRPARGNQIGIDQKRKEQLIIIIGPNAAGKCIGKGGENVKRLKSEYSVYVRCMAKEDIIPGLEERTVTISGEQENVSKAAKDILDLALTCKNGGTDRNLDYDTYMGGAPGGAPAGGQFGGPPQQGFNGSNMGNSQYGGSQGNNQYGGGNQGSYGGNNYNQQQGGYNAPPAQGGFNTPNNSFNQPPQQYNNNTAPQQAPPQGQFPPSQGIQQYNQPPQYNNAPAPGPVQQYGAPPAQEVPPVVLPGVPATPLQQYGAPPVQQYNNQPPTPAYIAPVNNAPPAANIAVQQYPSQGGYQGAPNNGPGPNQGYQGNNQGYQGGNQQGGYQGNQGGGGGGYQGNNQGGGGGYQGGNQGGYQGGNQGGGGGYQGNRGGGYQGNRGGNRGNYGGGRGGGRGGRGK